MSFLLGLTGSIGMGKSTTAQMFAAEGCALWDADKAVHALYAPGGEAVTPLGQAFPDAIEGGAVNRARLKEIISKDPEALGKIERIVHPLVAQNRADFVANTQAEIIVFDIPLLFETGDPGAFDAVACVTVPPEVQRARVMERGTMTDAQFDHILSKQIPNATKCAKSDFVIVTDTPDHTRAQVRQIVEHIREGQPNA